MNAASVTVVSEFPIVETAPARVGILGNPSDGYGGRTLALAVPAFGATVSLEPFDRLVIEPVDAGYEWGSVAELVEDVDRHGYGGGQQLLAATVRTFVDVTKAIDQRRGTSEADNEPVEKTVLSLIDEPATVQRSSGGALVEASPEGSASKGSASKSSASKSTVFNGQAFRLRYQTTIPRQVGLAGSSALVIACLRCLGRFVGTELPADVMATIALRVETEQLGITAGLQDRVVQAYGGLVAMDFGEMTTDSNFGVSVGNYTKLDLKNLPPLFASYRLSAAEGSDVYHRELRRRFDGGDATVRETLRKLATLVVEGEAALRWGDSTRFAALIAENMRLRRTLAPLSEKQLELVDAATAADAQCTFSGSGGAIVGAYQDLDHYERLSSTLATLDAFTIKLN